MFQTALTAEDVAALEKAIARGVKTVQYANQTVTYQSTADMMRALDYARNATTPASQRQGNSTLAVFSRD